MNKTRFIASSVRIAGTEPVYMRRASVIFANLVPDRENCDGLKLASTADAIAGPILHCCSGGAGDKNVFRLGNFVHSDQ
jgi:hypothetical protein